MAFFSEIIGRPITDVDGKQVGVVKDLVAKCKKNLPHPVIEAVVIGGRVKPLITPYACVAALLSKAVPLNCRLEDASTYEPESGDIFLARDVLDKQIIDTNGARVVRVNDLELIRVNGSVFVSNVDVGTLGVLRRIGLGAFGKSLIERLHLRAFENYISWDEMEVIQQDQFMRLKVPGEKIRDLHPADIADIISDMNRLQGSQFLESFDVLAIRLFGDQVGAGSGALIDGV